MNEHERTGSARPLAEGTTLLRLARAPQAGGWARRSKRHGRGAAASTHVKHVKAFHLLTAPPTAGPCRKALHYLTAMCVASSSDGSLCPICDSGASPVPIERTEFIHLPSGQKMNQRFEESIDVEVRAHRCTLPAIGRVSCCTPQKVRVQVTKRLVQPIVRAGVRCENSLQPNARGEL